MENVWKRKKVAAFLCHSVGVEGLFSFCPSFFFGLLSYYFHYSFAFSSHDVFFLFCFFLFCFFFLLIPCSSLFSALLCMYFVLPFHHSFCTSSFFAVHHLPRDLCCCAVVFQASIRSSVLQFSFLFMLLFLSFHLSFCSSLLSLV